MIHLVDEAHKLLPRAAAATATVRVQGASRRLTMRFPTEICDDTLIGARLGGPYLEHLDLQMQGVVRPYAARPAKLVESEADDFPTLGELVTAVAEQMEAWGDPNSVLHRLCGII